MNDKLKQLKQSVLCVSSHSPGADSSHLRPLSADVAMLTSVPLEKAPSRHEILQPGSVTPAPSLFLLPYESPLSLGYRCSSNIPPSSSLKRCSSPEALPPLSTAALNAPTPVILAPDSRSFVDNGARPSLAVGVLSVSAYMSRAAHPIFAIFTTFHYVRDDQSCGVAEWGTFVRG